LALNQVWEPHGRYLQFSSIQLILWDSYIKDNRLNQETKTDLDLIHARLFDVPIDLDWFDLDWFVYLLAQLIGEKISACGDKDGIYPSSALCANNSESRGDWNLCLGQNSEESDIPYLLALIKESNQSRC